jgi:Fanconi anemia group M protein|tara:strand:- start:83491 stop:84153 length:663 start_codon:yes stop_codon:yes gene_type:complete
MKIWIDHRERNSGIIKELGKKGFEVEVKQLITADFIIPSKNMNNKKIFIGIERKTKSDFLNSIIDKRIIQQLITLKENFDIPLLIIEGKENIYRLRNFHPNAIRGMLASIAIDFQVPIIYTNTKKDTASLIHVIAKRLEKPVKNIDLLKKKKPLTLKEQQEYIIYSLPGIGPTLAQSLLKKFKSVKKIINAKEDKLKKVEKIGDKKTKEIKKVLEEEYKD